MNEKRLRKLDPLKRRRDLFLQEGDPRAALAVIAWGSVAGVAREGVRLAWREGIDVKLLVPKLIYPVGEEVYAEFLKGVTAGLVVEQSHQGQLYRVLRMFLDLPRGMAPFARSGALPILPTAIVERLRERVLELQGQHVAELEPAG
jgi:2-oxoglutarate ferredoxin oxidoreductase subunit alpha